MPADLGIQFLDENAKRQESKHRSIQFSGCLGSAESEFWRKIYLHRKPAVKIGKSYDVVKRMNEYMLYFPFANPGMRIHCLLCFPHAVTKLQKSKVDRCETYLLSTLKTRYPNRGNWPGINEKYRLFFQRSEWTGIPLPEIETLFKHVQDTEMFGKCMYVLNDGKINIPEMWYKFRSKVTTQAKDDAAVKKAQKEKDDDLQAVINVKRKRQDDLCAPRKYKTTAADRRAR